MGSGELRTRNLAPKVLVGAILICGRTLFTSQYFHGGVWGSLHNKSVRPKVEISNIRYEGRDLIFQLYRVEGADVYGSFLIKIELLDPSGQLVEALSQEELSAYPLEDIKNHYIARVKPGKHSLIIPLGAKADFHMAVAKGALQGPHTIRLTDISGIQWEADFSI